FGKDSAYTHFKLPVTFDTGDNQFYSNEWHICDSSFRMYQEDMAFEEGAIPSPQENYGGSNFVLESSDGTVVYSGLIIAGDRLSDAQRARLSATKYWSMYTLLNRPYMARLRSQFELRPY